MVLVAIAASSRLTYPKDTTPSKENPKEKMKDWEAFRTFLGNRLSELLFRDDEPDVWRTLEFSFKGERRDLSEFVYKYYRCSLVHEAKLPAGVDFRDGPALGKGEQPGFSLQFGDTMILDTGWLDVFREAVVHARCNAAEFGIEHFELRPLPDVDEDAIHAALIAKYNTTPGRIRIFKGATKALSPEAIAASSDEDLADNFQVHIRPRSGYITALRGEFADEAGRLLPPGVDFLRELSAKYQLVKVA